MQIKGGHSVLLCLVLNVLSSQLPDPKAYPSSRDIIIGHLHVASDQLGIELDYPSQFELWKGLTRARVRAILEGWRKSYQPTVTVNSRKRLPRKDQINESTRALR